MLLNDIFSVLDDIRSLIMLIIPILVLIFVVALVFEWPVIALFSFIGASIAMTYDDD